MKINFFGDFVATSVENLKIDQQVKNIIDNGDINVINFEVPCPKSPETKLYIERINEVLADEEKYMNYINEECARMLEHYYNLFRSGGLYDFSFKRILKEMIKLVLLRRKKAIQCT